MSEVSTAIERLQKVDLFAGFEEEVLKLVAAMLRARNHGAGEVLFLRGDPGESMFIVAKGQVRLSIVSSEGREITVRHVGAGGAFGEIALLDGGLRTATATASRPTSLLVIPRAPFQAMVEERPAVAQKLIRFLCTRLRDTTDQLEAIALMPLEQRLAQLLLKLARAAGGAGGTPAPLDKKIVLPLDMTQGELATLLAASRPKVNQILVGWDASGIVRRTPEGLLIDAGRLSALAEGDDG